MLPTEVLEGLATCNAACLPAPRELRALSRDLRAHIIRETADGCSGVDNCFDLHKACMRVALFVDAHPAELLFL